MSNVIAFPRAEKSRSGSTVADELLAATLQIGAAAQALHDSDIDAENLAEALVALYEAARFVKHAAQVTQRAILGDEARS